MVGCDLVPERREAARAAGIVIAATAAEVAAEANAICLCLTNTGAVAQVVEGASGIVSAGHRDSLVVIDHSTTEIEATKRLAAVLRERAGAAFI
ncbi:MAG TPA: NAD(P)-binding domain-containing protein, partial [Hyphomicrobiaceae bacterium]|nr:NAD(P)-binding domain-containing protein [Hyphomicrobiaceae bacterium]